MCSGAINTLSLFSHQGVSTFPATLQVLYELGTCSKKALKNLINYSLQNRKGNILVYGLYIVRQNTQIHFHTLSTKSKTRKSMIVMQSN